MNTNPIRIGDKLVGDNQPVYVIAEIGINHNGSLDIAKRLIDAAFLAGCDAVKFQKRTPEKCVPFDQRNIERDTPWGRMTYINYRHRMEFGKEQYDQLNEYCRSRGISWFASCWDEDAVDFIGQYDVPCSQSPLSDAHRHRSSTQDEGNRETAHSVDWNVNYGGNRNCGRIDRD